MKTTILEKQLLEIGSYIEHKDILDPTFSKTIVGWHLAHILKVFHMVCTSVEKSNPADYKKQFSLPKTLVFLTGKIPRGKAKSPKAALPEENFQKRYLEKQLHEDKQQLSKFENFDDNAHFLHPYFKQLNKKETLKFLKIHNEHHLKIVRDILEGN